ncbi:hypothetical protein [Actinophytocola oryzae]|uniref:Uncharacterized protein n=1 Tax=Actinophytocola oryzae TaxID=502181 RepID=A0A4V3FQP3_9PSEU|nr:hypothetical protein [Actinophytocola oryzae]TDV40451.1 hypothetical protein CLV71_123161 [Actinophytocola oryzae]
MFKDFIAWLDSYISREEPSAVLKAMVGLMAFAGLLGTLFGNQAIRAGAFVTVIVFAALVMLLLLADRRSLSKAHEMHRTLLARYCDFVIDHNSEPLVSFESWGQKVYVHRNGDVREVLTLRAVALRTRVYFIRLKAGSRWDQPERYRRDVRVIARSLTINGATGPRWNVTSSWVSTQKMNSILHLHHSIKRGEEIFFEVIRIWPAKCLPLVKGEAEEFSFCTTRLLEIQHVDYSVVLPEGLDATYELIGAAEPDVQLSADTGCDHEGRRVFTWRADKVPTLTTVGIRLELK